MATGWLHITTEPEPSLGDIGCPADRVRGSASRTRSELFSEWATALHFPTYFSHNWDSFADAFGDLPDPLAVIVNDADQLLAEENPTQLGFLLAILKRAAEARNDLRIVLVTAESRREGLRQRVALARPGRS